MTIPTRRNVVSEEYRKELADTGLAIYTQKLKALLEPERDGEYVAIHVDTEDYTVGASFREAKKAILNRHPIDGRVVIMKIGDKPENNPLLGAGLLDGYLLEVEMTSGRIAVFIDLTHTIFRGRK